MKSRESIHDEQIAPLMREVIRICKAHDIRCFASFRIDDGAEHEDDQRYCTTNIPSTLGSVLLDRVCDEVYTRRQPLMAFTITSAEAKP
jgi:hypothetical protein